MKCLNLGCGNDYKNSNKNEKWINLDFNKETKADVYYDLNKFPYPFKTNSFDKIYTSHIIEHMTDIPKFMKEVWRISKNNTKIIIKVPHFSVAWNYSNPTHYHSFTLDSFDYFNKDYHEHYGEEANFEVIDKKLIYIYNKTKFNKPFVKLIEWFANLSPKFCERIWCYWVGGFDEIYVELITKK